jgi:hypothetical protein
VDDGLQKESGPSSCIRTVLAFAEIPSLKALILSDVAKAKKSTLVLAGLESKRSTCFMKEMHVSRNGTQHICVSLINHLATNEIRVYVLWSVKD